MEVKMLPLFTFSKLNNLIFKEYISKYILIDILVRQIQIYLQSFHAYIYFYFIERAKNIDLYT